MRNCNLFSKSTLFSHQRIWIKSLIYQMFFQSFTYPKQKIYSNRSLQICVQELSLCHYFFKQLIRISISLDFTTQGTWFSCPNYIWMQIFVYSYVICHPVPLYKTWPSPFPTHTKKNFLLRLGTWKTSRTKYF